jgi:hypothetical protein
MKMIAGHDRRTLVPPTIHATLKSDIGSSVTVIVGPA